MTQGQERKASSFKSQFKVPDSRFWWIKIRALADKKEWDALFLFAKGNAVTVLMLGALHAAAAVTRNTEKKSPIGYRPFADVCIEQGAKGEALTYIPRIADAKQRIDYFLRVGYAVLPPRETRAFASTCRRLLVLFVH